MKETIEHIQNRLRICLKVNHDGDDDRGNGLYGGNGEDDVEKQESGDDAEIICHNDESSSSDEEQESGMQSDDSGDNSGEEEIDDNYAVLRKNNPDSQARADDEIDLNDHDELAQRNQSSKSPLYSSKHVSTIRDPNTSVSEPMKPSLGGDVPMDITIEDCKERASGDAQLVTEVKNAGGPKPRGKAKQ